MVPLLCTVCSSLIIFLFCGRVCFWRVNNVNIPRTYTFHTCTRHLTKGTFDLTLKSKIIRGSASKRYAESSTGSYFVLFTSRYWKGSCAIQLQVCDTWQLHNFGTVNCSLIYYVSAYA